jgi:hypothetical protein
MRKAVKGLIKYLHLLGYDRHLQYTSLIDIIDITFQKFASNPAWVS